jgi:hypothetical protein
LPKTFSCEEFRERGKSAQQRRTARFLDNGAARVNADRR